MALQLGSMEIRLEIDRAPSFSSSLSMFSKLGRKAMRDCSRRIPFLAVLLSLIATAAAAAAAAANILAANAFINHTEFLVSSENRFKLGFFSPTNSNLLYLGIWYSRIPTLDVVWVANRRRPLTGTSTGFLTMAANGSLIVTDGKGRVYWSTEATQAGGGAPAARLLDNGNLVVDTGGTYAWQSFDHPTDTMLPGMKLGYDHRRGVGTNFTSWRGTDDPSPGPFTMVMDPKGDPQVMILEGAAAWWRTGPWVGRQYSGIPDMRPYNNFSYSFVSNDEGIFYRYDVWDNSVLTKVVVNSSGSLVHQVWLNSTAGWETIWWSPGDRCDFYNVCGPNAICSIPAGCTCLPGFKPRRTNDWMRGSTDAGCEPEKSASACRDGKGEFKMVSSVKLPDTSGAAVDQSKGTVECRAACLQSCSCTAFTSSDGSGCITWSGELLDLRAYPPGQGQELYVRMAGSTNKKKRIALVIILLSTGLVVLLVLICLYSQRQRLRKRPKNDMQYAIESCHDDAINKDLELKIFPFGVIASATNNFSYANKLGEGGFGPVYKGILNGREDVAVKRLSKSSGQGLEEYKSEIQLMAKLQHTNLVKLLGCCIEAEEKILVYEYMPNQSLDKFIFDPKMGVQLDWEKRLHIIEGITQGLLYLHKYSRLTVVHRDLKASNILLDNQWNPKISDFGLARIFTWNDSQANTNRIVGTYGYMPPEYAMKGLFSVKSDVFSYGVLLLEILSGKKNTSIEHFGTSSNLIGHAWRLWIEGRELELMDPVLGSTCSTRQISRRIHIALLSVQVNPIDRPTMFDVVSMLNNETVVLPPPNRPAFFLESLTAGTRGDLSSTSDMTLTEVRSR